MKFTARLSTISASPTMAVMEEAQRLRKQGVDVIDFGPGEPDFPTPEPIKQAGIDAINRNITKYTAAAGLLELRRAVADKFNREWDTDFSEANVAITCGAKHAIFDVCMAVFEDGDQILIPSPYWVTFPAVIEMTRAVLKAKDPGSADNHGAAWVSMLEKAYSIHRRLVLKSIPSRRSIR